MENISKNTKIEEAIKINEEAVVEVLNSIGMHCVGCAMASGETLGEAAVAHGHNPDELVKKINDAIDKK